MKSQHVIFVSAVSAEFHRCPPEQRHLFESYRDVLKAGFRMLAPHYEVIVQEDLVQGTGDLLDTLDLEVARSLVVIHLVGDLAGWKPEAACLRELHARHGQGFLTAAPELRAALGDEADISYTQWEAYLAFHHGKPRLIFEAQPGVPRSPLFVADEKEGASQERHRTRLQATGAHRGPFENQGDVARKTMRSFLHFRLDPGVDAFEPTQDALDEAWAHQEEIVQELAAAIKKPDPRAVPVTDPANVAAFVAAVRACAEKWHVNLATIVAIAARHEEQVRAAAEERPAPETLYEQALAELALGDFTAARHTARRAADLALQFRQQQPEDPDHYREAAVNALLLLHDAANGAHDPAAAIAALEEAGTLIDKERDPLLWAEVHEPLARFLLEHAHYDRADDLISDILDIREQRQGENHRDLARTLMQWSELLQAKADFRGMESVAARAGRILAAQVPPDGRGISAVLNHQAEALKAQGRLAEAEPLMRRALAIDEAIFGPAHPEAATGLNNLAGLLQATNRLAEAELLIRRALAIDEASFGPYSPVVAIRLNNLAQLLQDTNRLAEAEPLMRRSLTISESCFGPEHPNVARGLSNLGSLLDATSRPAEAEPLMRRAVAVLETNLGPDHPDLATGLNNLAQLLKATDQLTEAEPLMRQQLVILLNFTSATAHPHPDLKGAMLNYAGLLKAMGRSDEEIGATLREMAPEFFAKEEG